MRKVTIANVSNWRKDKHQGEWMVIQKKRISIMLFFTAFWFTLFYVLGTVELSLTVAVLEIGMGIVGAAFIFTILRCIITPLIFGRAFCSWVCWSPGVFDLLGLYRGKQCGTCETNCPMGVSSKTYVQSGDRVYDRECILCGKCIDVCPENVLKYSFRRDKGTW